MTVSLLYNTPLWVAAKAIRKCWASENKSDSTFIKKGWDGCSEEYIEDLVCGTNDRTLIERVGNKNKHASTLEHLVYTFDIDGISRACLQELARHRHASMSVKSTRYTLKELKSSEANYESFLVQTGSPHIDAENESQLDVVSEALKAGVSNDLVKYLLPEAYKTSLVWTINARALQNFLVLRTNKAALWEIRELAYTIFDNLPEEHKYLFKEFINEKGKK